MSSDPEKPDDDLRPLIERLGEEFGPRREHEPAPVYGEARPLPPQQTFQLRLPIGRPRAVWVILALNVAIFVIPTLLQAAGVRVSGFGINDYLLLWGEKKNDSIAGGEYYRFLTSMFLHGGLLHIFFNAWALYALGPETERIYGTARFLALYFIAGLAGGLASYALSPAPAVGASGAIFGLVGGLASFYYIARKLLGDASRQQLGSLITVILINLFIGFSTPRIDNNAHIGGLIGGLIVGALLAPRFAVDERLYPPQVVRRGLAYGWAGAIIFLALLVILARTINPPLQ